MKPQIRTIASLIDDGSILGLQDGNHGGDHPKASEYVSDGVPFIMASDIRDCRLNLADCQRLPKERTDRLRIGFAKAGDVLLTHKGTVGEVCITPAVAEYVMLTPQVTYYRVNPKKLDNRYLCAALRGHLFREQLDRLSPQSTRPYVPISIQKALRIEWYPRDVQHLIGSRVAVYDDLIENNTRRIAILEETARRIFEEWFVHFRAPGCEGLPMVDSAIGPVPKGWEVKALHQLANEIRDPADPRAIDPDTPYIGLEHIPRRSTTFGDWGKAGQVGSVKLKFQMGDILFGKIRPYFHKCALAPVDGVASSDAIIIRPKQAVRALVTSVASSDAFVAHAVKTSNGTKMPRADWKVLREYPVAVPPDELARQFEQTVWPMIELEAKLAAQSRNLRAQRDILLPKLISGEIDVSAANDLVMEAAE